jgi:hypothetical protein
LLKNEIEDIKIIKEESGKIQNHSKIVVIVEFFKNQKKKFDHNQIKWSML